MVRANQPVLPSQDEVWIADLDPATGHEQGGTRPVVVVSCDRFNRSPAGLVTILPITSTDRKIVAHVRIDPPEGGLTRTSFVMTDQLRTISRLRLQKRVGRVSPATKARIEILLGSHLGLR